MEGGRSTMGKACHELERKIKDTYLKLEYEIINGDHYPNSHVEEVAYLRGIEKAQKMLKEQFPWADEAAKKFQRECMGLDD